MIKNKSYIGIFFVILVFGIFAVPRIIERIKNGEVVKGDRLDNVSNHSSGESSKLVTIGPAPKFELTNQNNQLISNKTYAGKVYVLEFFFSTCPSICPIMNLNMTTIQNTYFGNPNFAIASITINPENDTPSYRIVIFFVNRPIIRICSIVSDVPDEATTFSTPAWWTDKTSA